MGSLRPYFERIKGTRKPAFRVGEEMVYEAVRWASFAGWPIQAPHRPHYLALNGLYYIQRSNKLKCFACSYEFADLMSDAKPELDHKRFSPTCAFIQGKPCGNVEINYNAPLAMDGESSSSDSDPSSPNYLADDEGTTDSDTAEVACFGLQPLLYGPSGDSSGSD